MSEILIMNYKTYIVNVPRTQTMEKDSLNKIPTASPNPSKLLPKQTTSEVPLYSMIKQTGWSNPVHIQFIHYNYY